MWPVIINLGGVSITWFGLVMGLSFVIFSFILWRKMRVDYKEEDILTFTIFLALVGILASIGWKWWSVGGVLITIWSAVYLWSKKKEWDFWEWLDLLLPLSLLIGAIASAAYGVKYLWATGILLTGYFILALLRKSYRKIGWYKSGKMGFVGMAGIIWWNVAWILVANWQPSNVYFGGLKLEQWIGIWSIVAAAVCIYLRGGRKVTQDWKYFTKLWQPKIIKKQ
jgi:hypothetical protein